MKLNRALAFLISMTVLIGVLPVSAVAADYAGDGITMGMEVGDPCANGHDYESVITREPTCEKTGIETFTCSVCGDTYDEEIPKTDHEYDGGKATDPTCTKAGKVTYTCTVCGHTETEEGEPALGHSYTVKETKATCEKAGEIVYTCTRCGDKYKEEGEEALGHDYEKKVTKPATETAEGEVTYTCKRCKDSYKEAIPRLGKMSDKKGGARKTDGKDDTGASSFKVTLPSGKGYAVMAMGETTVDAGDSFSFTLNIAEGYRKGKDFSVKAGDTTLKEGDGGTYTIKNIKKDVKVKVSGVEKAGDMDEELIIPASEEDTESEDTESAGAANGAQFATDEPAVPAEDDLLADDPLNSGESEYGLYVGGKPVTRDNKGDVLGEDDDVPEEDGGKKKTVVYDVDKKTLTLDDASVLSQDGPAVYYTGSEDLTIEFKGDNVLTGAAKTGIGGGEADDPTAYGILQDGEDGSLAIKSAGEGRVQITNAEAVSGKKVSLAEDLCISPDGYFISENGLTGDESGVVIAADHDWGQTEYEWSGDYSECTAKRVCATNSKHEETETVTKDSGKVTESDTEEPGKIVYTAAFENPAFEKQVKKVDVYGLFIKGESVTALNKDDILGDKTVIYDADRNVLKLNGAVITSESDAGPAVYYTGKKALTIEFEGDNTLTGTAKAGIGGGETPTAYGILAANGSLAFKANGTGTLKITNKEAISGKEVSLGESFCISPAGYYVDKNGLTGGESGVVIASDHDWGEWKKSGTEDGREERICSRCGEKQTRDLEHEHTLEKIEEKPATCTENGHIAYYKCTGCGLLFSDEKAQNEISEADLVPEEYKAAGHDWGETEYKWADDYSKVTAARICKKNKEHVETEVAATAKEVKQEATCEAAGDIIYTATFENPAFTVQTKEVKPAALGHQWGAPAFHWSDGYTKATATFTCRRDSSHTTTVKAAVKGMITMPTTNANGKIAYTASVKAGDKTITDTKEAVIKPAGTAGYKYTASAYSWTNTSSSALNLTVKRSEYDAITFRAFTGVQIDGKSVSSSNFTTAKGSLKLALKKEYLKNLAVGAHTIKIQFKDGTAETKFTVRGTTSNGSSSTTRSSTTSPKTGDDSNAALWIGILVVAVLAIAGILIYRKRKNNTKE